MHCRIEAICSKAGVPAAIFSDNGTNFIGPRNEVIQLKLILAKRRNSVSQFVTNLGMMISPPHLRGLWEAGVKAVKLHLKKIMGKTLLSYELCLRYLFSLKLC